MNIDVRTERRSKAGFFVFAGFDFNQIRPRLPAPGRREMRQPSQVLPDFPIAGSADNPLPDALRLWATDRVIVHWTIP